jgi:hypothetical protein
VRETKAGVSLSAGGKSDLVGPRSDQVGDLKMSNAFKILSDFRARRRSYDRFLPASFFPFCVLGTSRQQQAAAAGRSSRIPAELYPPPAKVSIDPGGLKEQRSPRNRFAELDTHNYGSPKRQNGVGRLSGGAELERSPGLSVTRQAWCRLFPARSLERRKKHAPLWSLPALFGVAVRASYFLVQATRVRIPDFKQLTAACSIRPRTILRRCLC